MSCESEQPQLQDKFAVEAWIDNDGFPVVLLSRAVSPSQDPIDVKDVMVRWAKVTISDGEETYVMTGGVDHTVFPPFSYRSYAMRGEVGKMYTITAEYQGVKAESTSTILAPAEIMDVKFQNVSDSVYSGTLRFRSPMADDTCRYVIFTRVYNRQTRHFPAFMGAVSSYEPGAEYEVPLFQGRHADASYDYHADFFYNDTVDVMLARVDPDVYRFWDSYLNEVYFGNNIFISANNALDGNIVGGYGVFSARGVSHQVVVVR